MNLGWELLLATLRVLSYLIIARVLMSWVVSPTSRNPLVEGIRRVTDVVLNPISRVVPPMGGLDLTPMVALLLIHLLQNLIISNLLYSY